MGTVLHGIDQSVPSFYGLPAKGHPGSWTLQEDLFCSWLYDIERRVWTPYEYVAFEFDVSKDGGGIGFHNLDIELPADTLVWDGMLQVGVAPTSAGAATVAIKIEAAAGAPGDLWAASPFAWLGVGLHDVIPNGTAVRAIRTTRAQQVKLEIRGAALTAGLLRGYIRCFRSQDTDLVSSSSSTSSSSTASTASGSSPSTSSSSTQASTSSKSSVSSSTSTWSSASRSSESSSTSVNSSSSSSSSSSPSSFSSSSSTAQTSSSSSSPSSFSSSSSTEGSTSSSSSSSSSSSASTSANTDF